MARSRAVRKLAQNRATSSTDSGTIVRLGVLTRNRLKARRRLADAHAVCAASKLLEPRSDLTRELRECAAQGTFGYGNTLVDGGADTWGSWPDWNRT